ncbi:MAG: glycosyltransferase family 2 protein [Kiritimatiellae bacterium]|nr:glycosyltransferase family 2 protein [Kiritimatiellia bacterium]
MSDRAPSQRISVCIICGNEIDNIERCLRSVTWADEILVMDSFSTDGTYEVAKKYTDNVFRHEWLGYIAQKKLISERASCPWILFVDADEEVSTSLRDEIETMFSKPIPDDIHGFNCPRLVHYLGRWIWHGDWYPDMKLRLFRKDFGECGGEEPHDRIIVQGRVANMRGPLNHYTYDNISDQIQQINRFSSISAKTNSSRRVGFFTLLLHPFVRFMKCYFLKRGFLDGVPGLIIAVNVSFGTFVKYAKLWELRKGASVK